jgi:RNase P/RNase MRP subunit p29
MANGNYRRTTNTQTTGFRDSGPYEAIVVNNFDTRYMGGLVVELLRYTSAGGSPERTGQLLNVRYLSPFYGVTPNAALTANDGYEHTQKSYGMWMVPPDVGTKVLVMFAEGNANFGYWIGCIPADYMNFMVPDGRASTENTTGITPPPLKGRKLPTGEYNKAIELGSRIDPTLFEKPYNKDFTETLEVQGLLNDEARGTTTSSARREMPSAVFGISTPGPKDRRNGSPTVEIGTAGNKVTVPANRLGGSSFVMDDGDERFVRATHAEDGPPIYKNKGNNEAGGDRTIPQNELLRLRTRTGHQILMHNSEDLIYIGNARGTTWIEMTSDGKIDIHAQDSVSIMTENDLNITAERDINMEAGRNVNIKAAGRNTNGITGRVQIESKQDFNLHVGKDSKITVKKDQHIKVTEKQHINTGKTLHINSGQDNRLTATGSTHIKSAKEHRETATYVHMNGPAAAQANPALQVEPLSTITLPRIRPGGLINGYETIVARSPQHEPWPHHENLDPMSFKKSQTDRDAPGPLPSADRIVTPDTFNKNLQGRVASAYVAGSGGNVSTGQAAGGPGHGQTPVPQGSYSSDFEFSPELGSLSARYESRGDSATIGWDSTGGWSYGTYQLAAETGAMNEFHAWLATNHPSLESQLSAAGGAAGARAGTEAYKAAWTQVMATPEGAEAQHEYAVIQYFVPGNRLIKNRTGLDCTLRSVTVQNVVWSSAIQHGPGGARNIFQRALAALNYPPNEVTDTQPTDAALIRAVYTERRSGNGTKYFGRSTAAVRESVVNRFHNEEADALRALEQEVAIAAANPPVAEPTDNSAAQQTVRPHNPHTG